MISLVFGVNQPRRDGPHDYLSQLFQDPIGIENRLWSIICLEAGRILPVVMMEIGLVCERDASEYHRRLERKRFVAGERTRGSLEMQKKEQL